MNTWIKRSLAVALGATLLAGGLSACGHRGYQDHHAYGYGHGPGAMSVEDRGEWRARMLDRAAARLELDDAQKARLATLLDRLAEQRRAVMGAGQDPRAEFRALVAGERFDRARAQAIVTEKTEAIRAGSPAVIAAAADFYDGLNPAQQAKVREYMERRRGWRR